jgi:biopolymer transport protein ExbD
MPLKTHIDEQPTLNLAPMIDVVFLLIIFFMVGTQYSDLERSLPLDLPEVSEGGALTSAPEKRVINVYRDGRITLDQQSVSLDELTNRLAQARSQYQDTGVVVRGDGAGPFQHVAEVLNACKQAGISELAISVKLAQQR